MPSEFLVQFHKKRFPNGDVPLYSKDTFYALVDEVNRLEQNNLRKEEKKYEYDEKNKECRRTE